MLSDKLQAALNEQVNYELYSSYSYLAMSAYCETLDLPGFANFFRVQAQEELSHAMKFYDYIFQKNGEVKLKTIEQPILGFDSVIHAFETAYEHEQGVTKRIYNLTDLATEEKEHATISLLKWFIDEQVEEEDTFNKLIKKLKRSIENPAALYMLDDELAQRVYTPPTTTV
ncbi:ferritin [Clostridium intestinale]|jgi:ferritin|uniref:Ferritin n=2 Tax=Clostridium intestinale TaxID=36845 RepID=U2NSY2_9CLOT|nr:ferritin [Clostridium intestinale]ERK32293.1 Ferritin, Dps family protein [Clostridium intestinale URNW]QLY79378.1 ferritin [Clostridium intestinale]